MRMELVFVVAVASSTAAAQVATLTAGSAYIDGQSFVGVAADSVMIDQQFDWDGTGSVFDEGFTETVGLQGAFSIFEIDAGSTQSIAQNTVIDGVIGGGFGGVSTTSVASGSMFDNGPDNASQNSFLDSGLDLEFTVNDPNATFTLDGLLESTVTGATAELSVSVLLRRFEGGLPAETLIQSTQVRPDPDFPFAFDLAGDLSQGDWLFSLRIDSSVPSPTPGQVTSNNFAWDVDLAIVPAPSGAFLMAAGGLFASHRRRS